MQAHTFELAIQRLPFDAENSGCAAFVSVCSRKDFSDLLGFCVRQSFAPSANLSILRQSVHRRADGRFVDPAARCENAEAFDKMLHLADIAGPSMLRQRTNT